ncbi:HPP family protein [Halobium salinum]|uniref:HPP family protein n=1 Tax=Halobium salinum TaxID=1364940 RepID=A0ABD5PAB2_9EURY|nr:HPP family protein [Halobium salinum]
MDGVDGVERRLAEVGRRVAEIGRRIRRLERREVAEFGRWVENTDNLIHLTVLLVVPLLIALVTFLSSALVELSFLLFPPLASGTYTLFADPEGRYASPRTFVGGMTLGALCGWVALVLSATYVYHEPPNALGAHAGAAALAVFLVGAATWAFDFELPTAFSTALLVLLTGEVDVAVLDLPFESAFVYTVSVALSTSVVALVFSVWRREFYEQRAELLYGTTHGDDHVLVPMRGETATLTALFGARLAAAHEAGKVVLLDVVDDEKRAAAERELLAGERPQSRSAADIEAAMADDGDGAGESDDDGGDQTTVEETAENADEPMVESVEDRAARRAAAEAADRLEAQARRVRTRLGVPCEVVVASGDPGKSTIKTARATNCDLVVTPYEEDRGSLSEFVRTVFRGPFDAVAFRSTTGAERWRRVLVTVARPGDTAHAMIDFATRLAGPNGSVSVCTCISSEVERRPAESRLANLVETVTERGTVETRVARTDVKDFIDANAASYDLVVLGSSGDRSAASRFVSPPTFERLRGVDCDVAVVDRGQF